MTLQDVSLGDFFFTLDTKYPNTFQIIAINNNHDRVHLRWTDAADDSFNKKIGKIYKNKKVEYLTMGPFKGHFRIVVTKEITVYA